MSKEESRALKVMPFTGHIAELRKRLIVSLVTTAAAMIFTFITYKLYIPYMIDPLGVDLFIHEMVGPLVIRFKVAAYLGILISFPVHVYNIVAFVLPALRLRERLALKYALAASFMLILTGAYVSFVRILPMAANVLQSEAFYPAGVGKNVKFETAIMFEIKFVLAFLILFQLPLVLEILMAFNLLQRKTLMKHSRYIIVAIFILSAVFTPPDVVSQIGLALPLIFLFYLSIFVAKVCHFGEGQRPTAG